MALALPASAQEAASASDAVQAPDVVRNWRIAPRVSVVETLTDNVLLSSQKRSDLITQLAPGIRLEANSARIKAYADYELRYLHYGRSSQAKQTQNVLNAFGNIEAVDDQLFLDFSGVITRQTISAFGTQSFDNRSTNPNTTEASNFRLSPYFQGRFGNYVDYQLRYSHSRARSESETGADSDIKDLSGGIGGSMPRGAISWGIDAGRQEVEFRDGQHHEIDRVRARLSYRFQHDYRLSAFVGREANNFQTTNKETNSINGYSLEWEPGPRTQVSLAKEKRFFGDATNINLSHRTGRTIWRYTQSREVSALPRQLTRVGVGTLYDLFFAMSREPDLTARAAQVNRNLQLLGLPANAPVTLGFLTSRAFVERLRELSVALVGAVNTFSVLASESDQEALRGTSTAADDFTRTATVRQRGVTISWAHQLSGISAINFTGSRQNSSASGGNVQATRVKSVNLGLTTRIGSRTTASLNARRTEQDSEGGYRENAVIGTLSMQF